MGYPMAALSCSGGTMPLSSHIIRTAKVQLSKDNDFDVRAITFPDLALLVQFKMPELIAIVAKYQDAKADPTDRKNIGELAIMVARDFPSLAVEIISACVVGELVDDTMRLKIAALPMPIQLDALGKIAKMTVEESGGLGNLFADLRRQMTELAGEAGSTAPIQSA